MSHLPWGRHGVHYLGHVRDVLTTAKRLQPLAFDKMLMKFDHDIRNAASWIGQPEHGDTKNAGDATRQPNGARFGSATPDSLVAISVRPLIKQPTKLSSLSIRDVAP